MGNEQTAGTQQAGTEQAGSDLAQQRTVQDIRGTMEGIRSGNAQNYRNDMNYKLLEKELKAAYQNNSDGGNMQTANDRANSQRAEQQDEQKPNEQRPTEQPTGDIAEQAKAELAKLQELTDTDLSEEDLSDMTPERLDGIRQLRMIEEGDLKGAGSLLASSASRAGFPRQSIQALTNFANNIAGDDDLSKEIMRTISNHIYRNKN